MFASHASSWLSSQVLLQFVWNAHILGVRCWCKRAFVPRILSPGLIWRRNVSTRMRYPPGLGSKRHVSTWFIQEEMCEPRLLILVLNIRLQLQIA